MKRIVFRTPLFGLFVAVAIAAWWSPARSYAQSSSQTAGAVHESDVAGLLTQDRLAAIQQQVADAKSAGDNAWMLVSSALVLMMTGPGLALFYGGLVRKKNVLATMMQSFVLMALITVVWALFGYSLCFHSGTRFIGGLDYLFLRGVGAAPDADYAATIPQQTFMKFSAMVLFTTLWFIIVYAPMAHMVWGKGGFLNASLGGAVPTLDFAGGTVVHISSGVSALVCALYLGKRLGYPKEPMPPHSVVLSVVGACLLWVGWFGFNAGSALSAGSLATSAFVATHFGAAAAALGWAGAEWVRDGKPSVLGAISGCVAGLVAITPASASFQESEAPLTTKASCFLSAAPAPVPTAKARASAAPANKIRFIGSSSTACCNCLTITVKRMALRASMAFCMMKAPAHSGTGTAPWSGKRREEETDCGAFQGRQFPIDIRS